MVLWRKNFMLTDGVPIGHSEGR